MSGVGGSIRMAIERNEKGFVAEDPEVDKNWF